MPLLTVVIPVYNQSLPLARCLQSLCAVPVARQSDLQVVVVDDGSGSSEGKRIGQAVARCREGGGVDIRLLAVPHGGVSAARNRGIGQAEGRYLCFVDADDTVDTTHFAALLAVLESLPHDTHLFHTGNYRICRSATRIPAAQPPDSSATRSTALADVLRPRSGCLDMFTWLVSRQFLLDHPDARFPDGLAMLEDSLFVLQLLESGVPLAENPTLSPYLHHTYAPSATSGRWSATRCRALVPDICHFFGVFAAFTAAHADLPEAVALYDRYRYVYLRVLAVKGCPRDLLAAFRVQVMQDKPVPPHARGLRQALVYNELSHRLLAFLCRCLRKTKELC